MMHRSIRRALALALVASTLAAPAAFAAGRPGPGGPDRRGIFGPLGSLLASLWEKAGSFIDPDGAPSPGDNGSSIDPNGATSQGDEGSFIDPDGAASEGDNGSFIDPSGATSPGDDGSFIDPSG